MAWARGRRQTPEQEPPRAEDPYGEALAEIRKTLGDIAKELRLQNKQIDVLRLSSVSALLDSVEEFLGRQQLSFVDTMKRISEEKVSFARFGDGEFRMMLRPEYKLRFQSPSPELANELRDVFTMSGYDPSSLMIGFPQLYRNPHWSGVWADVWSSLQEFIGPGATFGNSHVSRPIFFQQLGQPGVDMWRKAWDGQSVVVVTGKGSRFSLVPELFDNAASVRLVESKPVDAFTDLPRLMKVLEGSAPEELHLVSLGPAGTVLAAWLSRADRRAVDVGHISDSYINVFRGGKWPERLDVLKP